MKCRSGLVGAMVGIGLTLGSAAAFARPPGCGTGSAAAMYDVGVANGRSLTARAWAQVNDCFALESFYNLIEEGLNLLSVAPGSGKLAACRIGGTGDGIFQKLLDIDRTCTNQCIQAGEEIGEVMARLYCLISIALNGIAPAPEFIQGPLGICGINMRLTCETTFFATAQSYPGCGPYTRGPFEVSYRAEMNNACYAPPPISIGALAPADSPEIRLAELWSRMNIALYTPAE